MKFSVNYNDINTSDDISNYSINIEQDNTIVKGTQIEIILSDYNLESLKMYFGDEKNYQKVINAFMDKNISISLDIDGKIYCDEKALDIKKYIPECQLYNVSYSSKEKQINFYYNDCLILREFYDFTSDKYELNLNLQIFQFSKNNQKNQISKLFTNDNNDLTPLIYINSNLFNNYNIFDPNIMKNKKNSQVLNQMIGFIEIFSSNDNITFNSDRTQFSQNEVTDGIISFLRDINIFIQKKGSSKKKHLVKLDFLENDELDKEKLEKEGEKYARTLILDTFEFKDNVDITISDEYVKYSIYKKEIIAKIVDNKIDKADKPIINSNKENNNESNIEKQLDNNMNSNVKDKKNNRDIETAKIILKNEDIKYEIPSPQINLYDFIVEAIDSKNNKINNSNIKIEVDQKNLENGILESINNICKKNIKYVYNDSNTGYIIKTLEIEFYKPSSSIKGKSIKKQLISLPSKENYILNFDYYVCSLINQVNKLDFKVYKEVIACSIRSMFEISIDYIRKSNKFSTLFGDKKSLDKRVEAVIEYISSNNKYITAIAKSTGIDYESFKALIKKEDFKNAIDKANLAAHKSTLYLSVQDIEYLADKASIFVIIINEMISNNEIN